jgi:hypothetical protein
MDWKFWKRKRKRALDAAGRTGARTRAETPFAQLPKPYAQRELIALQRYAGNQAVLRLLGLRESRLDGDAGSRQVERNFSTN